MEAAQGNAKVTVDLQSQTVTAPDGTTTTFRTPAVLREMLLLGADEIDVTLRRSSETEAFRARDCVKRPWAYRVA